MIYIVSRMYRASSSALLTKSTCFIERNKLHKNILNKFGPKIDPCATQKKKNRPGAN